MTVSDVSALSALGSVQKTRIRTWIKEAHIELAQHETPWLFAHDVSVYTKFLEMSDHVLGELMRIGTAENLRKIGYHGARSNTGHTIRPILTVALKKIEEEFGKEFVYNGTNPDVPLRGVRNETTVKARFVQIMDDVIFRLWNSFVAF